LEDFWVEVGCRVRWMNASEHDRLVARISHFPHVMAAATAGIALQDPGDARFGGGGLRDTTRVAGGDPGMWAEILLENREAVAAAVGAAKDSLTDILAMLERDDHEAVVAWLADSQRLHQAGQAAKDDELHG
jgi:prephenate dehydrogenase